MIGQDIIDQVRALIQPLQTRLANAAARAVISNVDASGKRQILQLIVLDGEEVDDCEHMQEYGFASRPLNGAEVVVLFPNGDRGHPLVVASDDKRHRPTNLEPGESAIYNNSGSQVTLKLNGDIVVESSGVVRLGSEGASDPVALRSDLQTLHDAIANAVPGASDGGKALRIAIVAALDMAGFPVAAQKVTAK